MEHVARTGANVPAQEHHRFTASPSQTDPPQLRPSGSPAMEIRHLGTAYGGWSFAEDERFYGSTIISCGLGEDASFDVEFAARYHAKVILVDPTPRAIEHYEQIRQRMGKPRQTSYVEGGQQPISAYDLSTLTADSLYLVPKAIWTHDGTAKFFAPANPVFVSHSLTGINGRDSHITVECTTMDRLLREIGIRQPVLVKLNIEGVASRVLLDMFRKHIYPRQILVEFEEERKTSLSQCLMRFYLALRLWQHDYRLVVQEHNQYCYMKQNSEAATTVSLRPAA